MSDLKTSKLEVAGSKSVCIEYTGDDTALLRINDDSQGVLEFVYTDTEGQTFPVKLVVKRRAYKDVHWGGQFTIKVDRFLSLANQTRQARKLQLAIDRREAATHEFNEDGSRGGKRSET